MTLKYAYVIPVRTLWPSKQCGSLDSLEDHRHRSSSSSIGDKEFLGPSRCVYLQFTIPSSLAVVQASMSTIFMEVFCLTALFRTLLSL